MAYLPFFWMGISNSAHPLPPPPTAGLPSIQINLPLDAPLPLLLSSIFIGSSIL